MDSVELVEDENNHEDKDMNDAPFRDRKHEAEVDYDDDEDDDDEDDDDLMNVEIPLAAPFSILQKQQQQQPAVDFQWDKNAILDCLSRSLEGHAVGDGQVVDWYPPTFNSSVSVPPTAAVEPMTTTKTTRSGWTPQPVPLPSWAKTTTASL